MARGGARIGAGRKKTDTVCYHRRVKPEWVEVLDRTLEKLKRVQNMKALAEQMQKQEPEANWEALSSDED